MDCSYAFDYSYILLYNLAFTSLAPIFMGILDQDVDDKVSLAVPQLYRRGIERAEWTQVKFWTYMIDGLYQSIICYFFTYLVFEPATFNTESGRGVNDYKRMGAYIANPVVLVVNIYFLMNTYRWDWFMVLICTISALLVFFWTGVYTAFTDGFTFYEAAPQVYGQLSFWANCLLTVILCLLPRFASKAFQKIYLPRDVDIVREQIRQGKFDYLKGVDPGEFDPVAAAQKAGSTSSSELSKAMEGGHETRNGSGVPGPGRHLGRQQGLSDDTRPIYPPSVAATATTHNAHSANGSDGTDYTMHRCSLDRAFPPVSKKQPGPAEQHAPPPTTPTIARENVDPLHHRFSVDRPRPSFDRLRSSMERTRPSIEASRDFTSAAGLMRMESIEAGPPRSGETRRAR